MCVSPNGDPTTVQGTVLSLTLVAKYSHSDQGILLGEMVNIGVYSVFLLMYIPYTHLIIQNRGLGGDMCAFDQFEAVQRTISASTLIVEYGRSDLGISFGA